MPIFFYGECRKSDFILKKMKLGQTHDPYKRLSSYGTAAMPDDKAKFRFLVKADISCSSKIREVERVWLGCFPLIQKSDDSSDDESDPNQAYSIEARRFDSIQDIVEKLQDVLREKGLIGTILGIYTKKEDIRNIMEEYKKKHIPGYIQSYSGKSLRDYQKEDIAYTLHAFREEKVTRGFWSIACGLGKTVMSYEVLRELNRKINLFVVPRENLLRQVVKNFLEFRFLKENIFTCFGKSVEGIQSVNKKDDIPTNPESPIIIVSTYDSLCKLHSAKVHLAIFDEAHHLVPSARKQDLSGNLFGLSDENIRADIRLFITATPKDTPLVIREEDGGKRREDIGFTHQPHLYGQCLAERNYQFGLKNGYLAPFHVTCMKVNYKVFKNSIDRLRKAMAFGEDVLKDLQTAVDEWASGRSRCLIDYVEREDMDSDDLSKDYKLWYYIISDLVVQAIKEHSVKRLIVYHTSIKRAEIFANILSQTLSKELPSKTSSCECVCSKNGGEINEEAKARFAATNGPEIRVLTNCRTLIEGFDEPSVDCTVFADNKYSPVECVQIVGRGNRKDSSNPNKEHYLIIPFLCDTLEDAGKQIIRSTNDYKTIRYVVKNIIETLDPMASIEQTVWVALQNLNGEAEEDEEKADKTARVWIPIKAQEKHDEEIETVLQTMEKSKIADEHFPKARVWAHELAVKENWSQKAGCEQDIQRLWMSYKDTHILPQDIPSDPSKTYKNVGWVDWCDYCGIFFSGTARSSWRDVSPSEIFTLLQKGFPIYDMRLSDLRDVVEKKMSRRYPDSMLHMKKISVYDLASRAGVGKTSEEIRKIWGGKYPDKLQRSLKELGIRDSLDFERSWHEIHQQYPNVPGIPTEVWDNFWTTFEDA